MTHVIEVPEELFKRLQGHAVPFVDTPLTVIERAIDALEAGDEELTERVPISGIRTFNPAAPPNLTWTTPKRIVVAGQVLPKSETYWNSLMYAVILEAAARKVSAQDILDLTTVNRQLGRREDNGFKYLDAAGISIQKQDCNAAWRQAYLLASSLGIKVEVTFAWQNNPKAAMPNSVGSFFVEGS